MLRAWIAWHCVKRNGCVFSAVSSAGSHWSPLDAAVVAYSTATFEASRLERNRLPVHKHALDRQVMGVEHDHWVSGAARGRRQLERVLGGAAQLLARKVDLHVPVQVREGHFVQVRERVVHERARRGRGGGGHVGAED
ncbi:hypothetical protein PybrP1_010209 [[Pythium] brassicae (nom. inval.)]|nr:hypothetical protein PybrP1_010209 [[Pythium] brassicae (nom. inval.)]